MNHRIRIVAVASASLIAILFMGCGAGKPRISVNVPAGTRLEVEIAKKISSESSRVGDAVEGRLVTAIVQGDREVLPVGTRLLGRVTEVVPTKKIGGKASLGFIFDSLELDNGERVTIYANFARQGNSQVKKDAATIGGAAAGGAVVGRVAKKKNRSKGTKVGALVGAAVGTAIAATNEGEPVVVGSGTVLLVELQQGVDFTVRE